jgi:hypothetical protein
VKKLAEWIMSIKRSIPWLQSRIPEAYIIPIFSLCIGYKTEESGYTKWTLGDLYFGHDKTDSLFRNGALFFRFTLSPVWTAGVLAVYALIGTVAWFWFDYQIEYSHWAMAYAAGFWGVGIRWAGKDPSKPEFAQAYIGPKLNGEWAVAPRIRIQSDGSAAAGTTGANYGQAVGWNEGNK